MLSTSFRTELEATRLDPTIWPYEPTFENSANLVGETLPFVSFFLNTALSCLATAAIAVIFATPAAYALSRAQFRLRGGVGYTVLIVRMLPMIVLLTPLYLLLLNARLLDTPFALIVGFSTFGLPFAVWMLKASSTPFRSRSRRAARVDGYPRWQILLRIVVPLILPGILTTGKFVIMEAWNNLIYPLTFITSLEKQTLPRRSSSPSPASSRPTGRNDGGGDGHDRAAHGRVLCCTAIDRARPGRGRCRRRLSPAGARRRKSAMARISLRDVEKWYGDTLVLRDCNLVIEDHEFVVLVGPSDSGKTTLLRIIAGLEPISGGDIHFDDLLVNDIDVADRDVAMVFQNYGLYPDMSVYDNMAFGLRRRGSAKRRSTGG